MQKTLWGLARISLALVIVVGFITATSGFADDDDDRRRNEEREREQEQSERADSEIDGQVLEINTAVSPPEIKIGSRDGIVTLRVIKADEIARSGVKVDDRISIIGTKHNELLFDVDIIRVDERAQPAVSAPSAPAAATSTPRPTSTPTSNGNGNGNGNSNSNGNGNGNSNSNGNENSNVNSNSNDNS